MNLRKKKELAARTLKVGKARIVFVRSRTEEIKDAITKQDIRDLMADGAIKIKPLSGRKKVVKRKRKRGPGKVKMKPNVRKKTYVTITRKLRGFLQDAKTQGSITSEETKTIKNKIRNRDFKNKSQLKEYLEGLKE